MNTLSAQWDIQTQDGELETEEFAPLTLEQLAMVGGGEPVVNSL
jgi:hypothetical protein